MSEVCEQKNEKNEGPLAPVFDFIDLMKDWLEGKDQTQRACESKAQSPQPNNYGQLSEASGDNQVESRPKEPAPVFSRAQELQIKADLKDSEGVEHTAYLDSRGYLSVGVGLNLDAEGAKVKLASVGADYDKVRLGAESLTQEQVDKLLEISYEQSVQEAKTLFPDLHDYSYNVKRVIVDMTYNMGAGGVSEFKQFKKSVEQGKYADAAEALNGTPYHQQVGRRAEKNMQLLKDADASKRKLISE